MSKLDLNRICSRLRIDPLARGLQVVDAAEIAGDHFPRLDTDRPAVIANVNSQKQLRDIRRTLRINYPSTHHVTVLAGTKKSESTLGSLPIRDVLIGPNRVVLYVPPLPVPGSPLTVAAIVARLRAPGGCPWDRKQTHASLRRALLEETYEVIEALDENDPAKLREEIGDLFLHVLFQTQIARDQNEFTLAEVGEELAAKLIRRHPHVFGEVQVENADEVVRNWERIKREEKGQVEKSVPGLDANIPRELPALARAQKVYERARRAGLDTPKPALVEAANKLGRTKDREMAVGEFLFALAAWSEENGVDASSALRQATQRFVQKSKRAGSKPAR